MYRHDGLQPARLRAGTALWWITHQHFPPHYLFIQMTTNNCQMFDRFKREGDKVEMAVEGDASEGRATQQDTAEGDAPIGVQNSEIGIVGLIDKRARLEEAIDYVGLMIKSLKDKRTNLEKEIEEESVDIRNLKEKLEKVNDYIEEENRGVHDLTRKRTSVEQEADEVAVMINGLKDRLSGIDHIIDTEKENIRKLKSAREDAESGL